VLPPQGGRCGIGMLTHQVSVGCVASFPHKEIVISYYDIAPHQSSEPCRGEDINANVTVDYTYEKWGVNGIPFTIHTITPM
jgi:hypothetical protein